MNNQKYTILTEEELREFIAFLKSETEGSDVKAVQHVLIEHFIPNVLGITSKLCKTFKKHNNPQDILGVGMLTLVKCIHNIPNKQEFTPEHLSKYITVSVCARVRDFVTRGSICRARSEAEEQKRKLKLIQHYKEVNDKRKLDHLQVLIIREAIENEIKSNVERAIIESILYENETLYTIAHKHGISNTEASRTKSRLLKRLAVSLNGI